MRELEDQRDQLERELRQVTASATWRWREAVLRLPGLRTAWRKLRGL